MNTDSLRQLLSSKAEWKRLSGYKEVPLLAELIQESEQLLEVGFGVYEEHNGLVAATDRRVLFAGRKVGSLFGLTKTEVFDYNKISSVQVNGSKLLSTLIVVTSNAKGEIKTMATPDCRRLADIIQIKLVDPNSVMSTQQPSGQAKRSDWVEELKKIADLKTQRLLTDDEFAQAKAKLLAS